MTEVMAIDPEAGAEETQILLASEDEQVLPPDLEQLSDVQVGASLVQRSRAKGLEVELQIVEGRYLAVRAERTSAGNRRRVTRYSLNLGYVDPIPFRRIARDWRWLKIGAGLGAATAVAAAAGAFGPVPQGWAWFWPATILLGVAAAMAVMLFFLRSEDKLVFHARYGRTPLVQILGKNPSKAEFTRFVEALRTAIRSAAAEIGDDKERLLKGELREHRRLRDDGVLPEAVYEKVKRRILLRYS